MKPEVRLQITPDIYAVFNTVEEIDDLSEVLASIRADLEHQIEMEKMRKREKNKRKRNRKAIQDKKRLMLSLAEFEKLKEKIQQDEVLAKILSPMIDVAESLTDDIKAKIK